MRKPVLFGISRSGGTLMYNLIREVLAEYNIAVKPQRHSIIHPNGPLIISIRDIRDTIVSHWRISSDDNEGKRPTLKDLEGLIKKMKGQFGMVRSMIKKYGNVVLVLKYEDFHENFDYLFDKIEKHLNITIISKTRKRLKKSYSKKEVKKKIITMGLTSFTQHDKLTHFHGKHIYTGDVGTWKNLLVEEDHQDFNNKVKDILKEFGYEN